MRETRTQQALGSHGHSRVTDSPGISHRKPGLGRSQGQPYPEAQGGYFLCHWAEATSALPVTHANEGYGFLHP